MLFAKTKFLVSKRVYLKTLRAYSRYIWNVKDTRLFTKVPIWDFFEPTKGSKGSWTIFTCIAILTVEYRYYFLGEGVFCIDYRGQHAWPYTEPYTESLTSFPVTFLRLTFTCTESYTLQLRKLFKTQLYWLLDLK